MPSLGSSTATTNPEIGTPTTLQPREFALLVACCSLGPRGLRDSALEPLLRFHLDWPRVIELGEHHGVLPQIYQELREISEHVPPEILDDLAFRYDQNVRRNLRFTAELYQILDCLESAGIPAIPHKGPVLAQAVYGDIASRDFSDLDVLVRLTDVLGAKEALRGLGYVTAAQFTGSQERAYIGTGYEYTFDGPAGRNLLELQWDVVPRFYAVEFNMPDLFARAVRVELAGRSVKTLAPEDLFLTLCVHAAKHAWVRLCWLRDIATAAISPSLNWEIVQGRATDLGVRRVVGVSLALAKTMLGASLPEPVDASINADRIIADLCPGIVGHISSAEEFRSESLEYFKLMLRLRERSGDRFRFATRLAFTPSVGEWELVSLPAPLFPLYRLVRLYRLARRPFRRGNSDSA